MCNYATSNTERVYNFTNGKAGDECIDGTDRRYTGLCKVTEPIEARYLEM